MLRLLQLVDHLSGGSTRTRRQIVSRQEFKVKIDVELPEDGRHRIERAIQRAVLSELAETDLADGYSVILRPGAAGSKFDEPFERGEEPFDPGRTAGIWIREEVEKL
jgi:hypothetical protein